MKTKGKGTRGAWQAGRPNLRTYGCGDQNRAKTARSSAIIMAVAPQTTSPLMSQ